MHLILSTSLGTQPGVRYGSEWSLVSDCFLMADSKPDATGDSQPRAVIERLQDKWRFTDSGKSSLFSANALPLNLAITGL